MRNLDFSCHYQPCNTWTNLCKQFEEEIYTVPGSTQPVGGQGLFH